MKYQKIGDEKIKSFINCSVITLLNLTKNEIYKNEHSIKFLRRCLSLFCDS